MKLNKDSYNRLGVGDIVIGQIKSVEKTPYSINNKDDAVLESDKDILAIIPSNEYSMYKNYVTDKKDARGLIYKLEVIDKFEDEGKKILKLSLRNTRRMKVIKQLESLKSEESVLAKIIGFSDFATYLKYDDLILTMTNSSFTNGNKLVKVSNILSIGDLLDVKFQKIKKRGREIRVLPLITLPKPVWQMEKDPSTIKEKDTLMGVVKKVTPKLVYIDIAKNPYTNGKVGGSSFHPVDENLDSMLQPGVEVLVIVDGVADNDYVYMTIDSVVTDSSYDYKMAYYKEVEKFYA